MRALLVGEAGCCVAGASGAAVIAPRHKTSPAPRTSQPIWRLKAASSCSALDLSR